MASGIITTSGPAIMHRGVTVQLPAVRTPLGEAVAALVAVIDAGELQPCRHCGAYGGCDCEEWIAAMLAPPPVDPHEDLSVWKSGEIPF